MRKSLRMQATRRSGKTEGMPPPVNDGLVKKGRYTIRSFTNLGLTLRDTFSYSHLQPL